MQVRAKNPTAINLHLRKAWLSPLVLFVREGFRNFSPPDGRFSGGEILDVDK